jgi:hypothetical protein
MTLSAKHLHDVCLLGNGDRSKTCRYLKNDELADGKWYCQKLQPAVKLKIDVTIEAYLNKSFFSIVSSGDNCEGYPVLKHVMQGYDIG